MTEDFSKFKFAEKFDRLPDGMMINYRGHLVLGGTIDMIPAGLKGIYFVWFTQKKPLYIAPDFNGSIGYYLHDRVTDMTPAEIEIAKNRYIANRKMVEKPRYVENSNHSLSLCSLPSDMRVFRKQFESGHYLDLTRTSVKEKQHFEGVKDSVLYPKISVQLELPLIFPKKVAHQAGPEADRLESRTRVS